MQEEEEEEEVPITMQEETVPITMQEEEISGTQDFCSLEKMQPNEYNFKPEGHGGSAGTKYQVKLLEYFLLQGFLSRHDFQLATEREGSGKFNDVEYSADGKNIQVQAEHIKNIEKYINFVDLFPEKQIFSKNLSIYKYLDFSDDSNHLILCTNVKIDLNGINNSIKYKIPASGTQNTFLVEQKLPETCLFPSFGNIKCYCFKQNSEIINSYIIENYNKNVTKNIEKQEITKETSELFFSKFILLSMSDEDLDNQIEELIKQIEIIDISIPVKTVQNFLYKEVEEWFQSLQPGGRGTYLTPKNLLDYMCQFKNQQYIHNKINIHQIEFNPEGLKDDYPGKISGNTVLLKIKDRQTYALHEFKILYYLENNLIFQDALIENNNNLYKKILFVDPDAVLSKNIIKSFEMTHYSYLVVPVWSLRQVQDVENLVNITNVTKTKKIIFVRDEENNISFDNVTYFEVTVKFSEFSEDIQEKILQQEIKFQGEAISIRNLIEHKKPHYDDVIDEATLLKLITKSQEIITVNEIETYEEIPGYVNRKLVDISKENFAIENLNYSKNLDICGEDEFCSKVLKEPDDRFIVIFGSPGMGKSTILNKLDNSFREKLCWIMKTNLKHLTHILEKSLENDEHWLTLQDVYKLFNISKMTLFEKNIFSICDKIILLDAFDELETKYREIILNTLYQDYCKPFKKILTSRHHTYKEFENQNITIYSLKPFSDEELINYLSRFWCQEINIDNKDKITEFAKILIKELNDKVNWTKINSPIGNPLQTNLISEIYKEECELFLKNNFHEFKLPEVISINWLYKKFIEYKKQVFIKKCDSHTSHMRRLLEKDFNAAFTEHIQQALKVEIPKSKLHLFGTSEIKQCEKETILKIGILKESGNKIEFKHKSFSEYFTAKHLCEFSLKSGNAEYFEFISEGIQLFICEMMLEDHLESENLNPFITQYFKVMDRCARYSRFGKYPRINFQIFLRFLSKTGYKKLWEWKNFESLKFLHSKVKGKDSLEKKLLKILNEVDEFKSLLNNYYPHRIKSNNGKLSVYCNFFQEFNKTFDDLGFIQCIKTPLHYIVDYLHFEKFSDLLLTKGHYINLVDHYGKTPLHLAIKGGNEKMAVNLLSSTAIDDLYENQSIDIPDNDGKTPLHYAAECSMEIIDLLLKKGHTINVKDKKGALPLHYAVGRVKNVELLLNNGQILDAPDSHGDTPLHYATKCMETTELLLKKGHPVNVKNKNGELPLHYAARFYKPETVGLLLNNGQIIDVADKSGNTPLHYAVKNQFFFTEITDLLLTKGHSINVKDRDGKLPLHYAVRYGKLEILKLLLNKGQTLDALDNDGKTPLHCAAESEYSTEIIILLLNKGHPVNVKDKYGKLPLHYAVRNGNMKIVELLLNNAQAFDASDNYDKTPLHYATHNSKYSTEIINLLLQKGHPVNVKDQNGRLPVHYAVCYKKMKDVELLLNNGQTVDTPDNDGKTPLHCSAEQHSTEIIELLLKKGHPVNVKDKKGKLPLHYAAIHHSLKNVELLLNNSQILDAPDNDGMTPLHYAVEEGSTEKIELLLKAGHPVNVKDKKGKLPLHYAAIHHSLKNIELLLNNGQTLDAPDNDGKTPLHCSAELYSSKITNLLLKKGHPVNIKDKKGKLPLHYASMHHSPKNVELLLNNGQTLDAPDNDGKTPLHYAAEAKSEEIIELLLKKGHPINVKDKKGKLPLHCAAVGVVTTDVELLLNNGQILDAPDNDGKTPLHYAAENKCSPEIFDLLLKKGHPANVKDKKGKLPLHYAAAHTATVFSSPKKIELLLNNCQTLDAPDNDGKTPLHCAAEKESSTEIIELLLKEGHPVNVKDKNGKMPLHYVAEYGNPKTLELLLNHDQTLDVPDNDGKTPLYYAGIGVYPKENINLLLNKGHLAKTV